MAEVLSQESGLDKISVKKSLKSQLRIRGFLFFSHLKNINNEWIAESPMGRVKVKFADKNKFGILDHDVTLPTGEKVCNPMRVFPNNAGSDLVFTLYKRPDMSDKMFEGDTKLVKEDIERLKALLEEKLS